MDVVPVVSPRDLTRFIRFPYSIYRDDRRWVAPLPSEERARLTPGKNPFFEHAEAVYFLARAGGRSTHAGGRSARGGGRDAGRIAVSVDRSYNEFHGERQAAFGFLESESGEAAAALLAAAEAWARERGAEVLRGPLNFTTNDDCGLLIRGFEHPPAVLMPYNPPTYPAWVEAAGFRKAKDLYAYRVRVPDHAPDQIARIAGKVRGRFRVRIRPMDMKRFEEELCRVKQVYNAAWDKNWGFVPMSDHEIEHMAAQLKPAVVPEMALFAEVDGETVGFLLAIPDVNVALRPLRGRLFPFGIVRLLWAMPRIRDLRLMALGVKAGYRRRGIDAALIDRLAAATKEAGYVRCEVGWTLEDNDLVNSLVEVMGGERYKIFRIYERSLSGGRSGT